jgi:hypothetical protein
MATTFKSGSAVKSGYYFNARRWHVQPVEKDGERLPEGNGEWMKVATPVALLLVPILGAAFLMFLPLIGFALALQAAATPVLRMFHHGATELASTVQPGWVAGEAHLTGKPGEKAPADGKAPAAQDAKLDALAKEIEEKRHQA